MSYENILNTSQPLNTSQVLLPLATAWGLSNLTSSELLLAVEYLTPALHGILAGQPLAKILHTEARLLIASQEPVQPNSKAPHYYARLHHLPVQQVLPY